VEDEEDDDGVAGPELPPDFEEEVVDDEEGRFFGGGITNDTAEVLNFIDERDKDDIVGWKLSTRSFTA
jgi:beta-catenin-like protein 1